VELARCLRFARVMRRIAALACLLGSAAPPAAVAQDVVLDDPTATWSFTWENDGFFGSDQNYTSGLRLAYLSGNSELDKTGEWVAKRLLGLDIDPSRLRVRKGVSIGQEIYTPADGEFTMPLPDQHPYAGYLYLRFTRLIEQIDRADEVSVELGIVGPSALGRQAQDAVHDAFDRERFLGWDNQIQDTPAVNVSYSRQKRVAHSDEFGLGFDCIVNGGFSVGTVDTSARVGANLRVGQNLKAGFGPPRVRPSSAGSGFFRPQSGGSWYAFAGGEVRARAHNIFLDGSLFRDDDPSVEKNVVVSDLQAGLAGQWKQSQVAFTYVVRSEEFETQDERQQFAAVSLSRRF